MLSLISSLLPYIVRTWNDCYRCWPFSTEKIFASKVIYDEGSLCSNEIFYFSVFKTSFLDHLMKLKLHWRQKPRDGKASKLAKRVILLSLNFVWAVLKLFSQYFFFFFLSCGSTFCWPDVLFSWFFNYYFVTLNLICLLKRFYTMWYSFCLGNCLSWCEDKW